MGFPNGLVENIVLGTCRAGDLVYPSRVARLISDATYFCMHRHERIDDDKAFPATVVGRRIVNCNCNPECGMHEGYCEIVEVMGPHGLFWFEPRSIVSRARRDEEKEG